MKNTFWKHPLVLLALAFLLGCVAHAVTASVRVAAQSDPSTGVYQECMTVVFNRGMWIDADDVGGGELPSSFARVPAGWHVAGAGGGNFPTMLLCR